MSTVPTQIRIDKDIKEQVSVLFSELGMDMSGAVNIFLRQCLIHNGLPFNVNLPEFNQETLKAMAEAKAISRDPNIRGYNNMEDLKKALEL